MNPFVVSGFEGPEYFCDRKTELLKLNETFDIKKEIIILYKEHYIVYDVIFSLRLKKNKLGK